MSNTYYKTTQGKYLPEYELMNAYFLTTGKEAIDDPHGYNKWLKSIRGKSIVSTHKPDEIEITAELYANQQTLCCKLYMQRNDCTLQVAYAALKAQYSGRCA